LLIRESQKFQNFVLLELLTKKGLSIRCELDRNTYPKRIKVSGAEMASLNITRDPFHPEWNYRIAPMNTT
jgi:hypothetical protein